MKVGVLDIGSNTLRGLWGSIDSKTSSFTRFGEKLITTRLGEGMSITKKLGEKAIERTLISLKELFVEIQSDGVSELYAFATSAVREASNRDYFLKLVGEEVGLNIEVLTGEEEAFQNLLGVEVGLGVKDSYLLFDIGGGSTEIVLKSGKHITFKSFPIGTLRLKDLYFSCTNETLSFLKNYWQKEAPSIKIGSYGVKTFIGVGGTVSALALLKEKASSYDIKLVHGGKIDMNWLYSILTALKGLPLSELERLLVFEPGRAYVIIEGGLILFSLMDFFSISEITISETNLLWGGLVKKWGVKRFIF